MINTSPFEDIVIWWDALFIWDPNNGKTSYILNICQYHSMFTGDDPVGISSPIQVFYYTSNPCKRKMIIIKKQYIYHQINVSLFKNIVVYLQMISCPTWVPTNKHKQNIKYRSSIPILYMMMKYMISEKLYEVCHKSTI